MNLKFLILLFLLFAGPSGFAQTIRISGFEQLMQTLNSGGQVRVVINYAKCTRQDKTGQSPIPDAIAGMVIGTYEYFAPSAVRNKIAFVVFSDSKLIQNPKGKGFVYNYGKVRINADNTVVITAKYLHPKNYKELMNEVFVGNLDDEGVELFSSR